MTREELEEALDELLPGTYHLTTVKGRLTIVTNLIEDEFGDLIDQTDADDDEEELDTDDEPFVEDDEDD